MKSKILLVSLLTGVAGLLLAAPASATSPIVRHGNDWARTVYTNDDIVTVNDGEADAHVVYVDYYLNDGRKYRVTDSDGANNGGATHDWSGTPYWISQFQLCESDGGGCTGWTYPDGPGGS